MLRNKKIEILSKLANLGFRRKTIMNFIFQATKYPEMMKQCKRYCTWVWPSTELGTWKHADDGLLTSLAWVHLYKLINLIIHVHISPDGLKDHFFPTLSTFAFFPSMKVRLTDLFVLHYPLFITSFHSNLPMHTETFSREREEFARCILLFFLLSSSSYYTLLLTN